LVGCPDPITLLGQKLNLRLPTVPKLRKAVQQYDQFAIQGASLNNMQPDPICFYKMMFKIQFVSKRCQALIV
jgi:hypothetical protein